MKKFIFQAIILIIVIASGIFLFSQKKIDIPFMPQQAVIKKLGINGSIIKVEIADTQSKKNLGLGGRASISSDEGMLFVYETADKYPYWMKGLKFPLDFVWIKDNKVVDTLQYAQPPTSGEPDASLPIYTSKEPVNQVLEVNGGTVQRLNIKAGDTITLSD